MCGLFSSWGEWGLLSSCHVQASLFGGFSFRGLLFPGASLSGGFSLRWLLFMGASHYGGFSFWGLPFPGASLSGGFSFQGLPFPGASLSGGFSCCRANALDARWLQCTGSVVATCGFSCSPAYRIFPAQGSNWCSLHWQVDSYPLQHQGSPHSLIDSFSYSFCKYLHGLDHLPTYGERCTNRPRRYPAFQEPAVSLVIVI